MPRYAPLPAVNIDPRSEAEIVNQAAKRVYDASNAKLNDFSAGNPMMALIEGQAFAQGEFLFWANQLPESILIEWIGPFLGALRRLGTPSISRLTITVAPNAFQQVLPAGSVFTTNSNLTNGESIEFLTTEDLFFPANEGNGSIAVSSSLIGTFNNVAANTITQASSLDLQIISVTNTIAAVGGSDVETIDEVKERFFTLIRRRNPVSSQDWQDLFEDLFGIGTFTSVLPNRSSKNAYVYLNDYFLANGHVSFFFLNPDGTEPTSEQIKRAQNVVDFSLPIEMQGHVYPLDLSQVQYNLELFYNPTADYAGFLKNFSLTIRDNLFRVMSPGQVFPSGYEESVADVNSALLETFPPETKYSEPDIIASRAYNTPLGLNSTSIDTSEAKIFEPSGNTFQVNDILTIGDPNSGLTEAGWPVIVAYTPYSSLKADQVLYENLRLTPILQWSPQVYSQGQVIRNPGVENSLLVVLKPFNYTDATIPPDGYILDQFLSAPKDFVPYSTGNQYYANNQNTGFYDPDLIEFDQVIVDNGICVREYFEPPGEDNLAYRIGWFVYVVNQDFVLLPSTNTTTGAQSQNLVSDLQVSIPLLKSGGTYPAGSWLRTPAIGAGANIEADPYYYYVDITLGVIVRYAYVQNSFTFLPSEGSTLNDSFANLVETGVLESVTATNSLDVQSPFQYQPRFPPQTYIAYQQTATSPIEYYFSLTGFTPFSSNPIDLIEQNLITLVNNSQVNNQAYIAAITPDPITGVQEVCPPAPMFTFSPGDVTLFRENNTVVSYVATKHFSPSFAPGVYIANGVLVPGGFVSNNAIPFYETGDLRLKENFIISEDGKNVYRVMRFFNAEPIVSNWDGLPSPNTARIEELSGNLLRVVVEYLCEESIIAPNGPATSGTKLGIAEIVLRSKSSNLVVTKFIWENTTTFSETPELSYATGAKEIFPPVSYGDGTLAL